MKFINLTVFFSFLKLINPMIYSEIFPAVSGAPNGDIYLHFAYPIRLPAKTVITIHQSFAMWQYPYSLIPDKCWCNFDYLWCQYNGQVQFQTSVEIPPNKIIEIYLDAAISLSLTAAGTHPGFTVTASWLGVDIAQDFSSSNTVTIKTANAYSTHNWQIVFDIMTPGAISNYVFKLTSDSDINPGYKIVVNFGRKVSSWICEPKNLNIAGDKKSLYYVGCHSDTLGDISCIAKHWYLIITGISKTVLAGNIIDFTLENLWTPVFGYFLVKYFILDTNDDVQSYTDAVGFTINNDFPSGYIDFKSLRVSDNHLLNAAKYEFEFYVGSMNLGNYYILVLFPQQYNFAINPPFTCNLTYFDESSQTPDKEIFWVFLSDCNYDNKYIAIWVPPENTRQFTSNMRLKVAIDSIINPKYACKNTGFASWENPNIEDDDYVSGKFDIEIFDPSIAKSIAKSWEMHHNVYTGLSKPNKIFQFVSKGSYYIS
ncbi:unnamed protein product [Blepharisma stoltei]|uniref:Uncharacterized protein n=1 Tax=Blepharisma stoltei TaxID=1481888 RepID=A0AAU9JDC3_9CILI|nr:unnamed protein product [Blepharisma stoltei]